MAVAVTSDLLRGWAQDCLAALGEARADIDALNVFPVPDGDTGTNLYLTWEAAADAVDREWTDPAPSAAQAAAAMSLGALLGARGNSGVIMSQVVRGFGDVLADLPEGAVVRPGDVAALLRRAADLAYASVARPVEGTILTVARAAAEAAEAAADGTEAATEAAMAAVTAAREALAGTPELLESLRRAGVVDAGGTGLVVVLESLARALGAATGPRRAWQRPPRPVAVEAQTVDGPAYEVMYLLDEVDDAALPGLRGELDAMGDSLVVVGGAGLWNVHVHVDDAGAAIEAALRVGRPHRIKVTHLEAAIAVERAAGRAVVAVAHGPGTAALLREAGMTVVAADPDRRPSTGELLEAMTATHAGEVLVLPSDSDIRAAAEAAASAARDVGLRVAVVPTASIVQTLAAAAVHDPAQPFDDDLVSMSRAAGATRYAAVTVAVRQALTTVGPCDVGDVLGIVGGDIAVIGSDLADVARELLAAMLAVGGELVTLVTGSDAGPELGAELPRWLTETYPTVELVVVDGGQPRWPLIMGVE